MTRVANATLTTGRDNGDHDFETEAFNRSASKQPRIGRYVMVTITTMTKVANATLIKGRNNVDHDFETEAFNR